MGLEDGTVVEGTILKRTTKRNGKFPNNFDVKINASRKVIRDVNFDAVEWHMDDVDIVMVEDVCQVNEGEVQEVFVNLIEKDRQKVMGSVAKPNIFLVR